MTERMREKIQAAQALMRQGSPPEAILALLEEAAEIDPTSVDPLLAMGLVHQDRADYQAGADAFTRVLDLEPRHAEALARRATCLVELHQFAEAEVDIQTALRVLQADGKPVHPAFQAVAAGVKLLKARHDAQTAYQQNPLTVLHLTDVPAVAMQLGQFTTLAQTNRLADAMNLLDRLIAQAPAVLELHLQRGNILRQLGHHEMAMRDLTTALCLDPRCTLAYLEQGALWMSVGRYLDVVANMDAVLAYAPDEIEAYFWRAQAADALYRDNRSAADYERFFAADLSQHPNARLQLQKAVLLFQRRRLEQSLEAVNGFLARQIPSPQEQAAAYLLRGKIHLNQGRANEAVEDCDRAITLDPQNADAAHGLAESAKQAERWADCARGWELYIKAGARGPIPAYVAQRFLEEARQKM